MKAAVLLNKSKKLKIISNIELPSLERGQILVQLAYSGVCHSQLMETRGYRGKDKYTPHLLGHEGSGKVVAIGPEVTKVKAGNFVILGWIKGKGIEAGGVKYSCNCNPKIINAGAVTTFNDYAIVSENRVTILPKGIPLDIAVLFGCALPTGIGIVINELKPINNSTIAIFGLGGIGMSSLIATKLFKLKTIIAIDVSEKKLNLAKSFGATHIINPLKNDPVKTIKLITKKCDGVDYAIEASGKTEVIEKAFDSIKKKGGICMFASHPKFGEKISIDPFDLISGKQIKGSWGGGSNPDKDIPIIAELYLKGDLPLEKLLGKRYQLDEINSAIDDLENNTLGRSIIEINPKLKNDMSL